MHHIEQVPVVGADNVFEVLENMGVRRRTLLKSPIPLDKYKSRSLSHRELMRLQYAPSTEVMLFKDDPENPFFRIVQNSWATVFALLHVPDMSRHPLVVITGEYKHGTDQVVLVPPSGIAGEDDEGDPDRMDGLFLDVARREFLEETGWELRNCYPLTERPLAVSGRKSTEHTYLYVGEVDPNKPRILEAKTDESENLKQVLIPLPEWIKLLKVGRGIEDCSVSVTFLALMRLGLARLILAP